MKKAPEIVVVSVLHHSDYLNRTIKGLNDAGINKDDLVLVESTEKQIRNPKIIKSNGFRKWVANVNTFVSKKQGHISSFKPIEVHEAMNNIHEPLRSSKSIGADRAAEMIMADVIRDKARKQKNKVIVVAGAVHTPRVIELLKWSGFNVKLIDTLPSTSKPAYTRHFSKVTAIFQGKGEYTNFLGKKKNIKDTQLEKAASGKAEFMRKMCDNTMANRNPWTMPTTFRFGPKGKLIPLRSKARKR